jgi:hypothetical protein
LSCAASINKGYSCKYFTPNGKELQAQKQNKEIIDKESDLKWHQTDAGHNFVTI